MKRARSWAGILSLILLVSTVLAGCLSRSPAPENAPDTIRGPDVGSTTLDDSTCSIEGIVFDEEALPLPGADVVLDEGIRTLTSDGGHYAFGHVNPGTHQLAASLVGYEPATRQAECRPGAPTRADFQLSLLGAEIQSYVLPYPERKGKIGCAVRIAWYLPAGYDPCKATGVDPEADSLLRFTPPDGDVNAVVLELTWPKKSGAFGGEKLTILFTKPHDSHYAVRTNGHFLAGGLSRITGTSPLRLELVANATESTFVYRIDSSDGEDKLDFSFSVAVPTEGEFKADPVGQGAVDAVYDMDFKFYLSLFYNGQPVPEGYTQLPG